MVSTRSGKQPQTKLDDFTTADGNLIAAKVEDGPAAKKSQGKRDAPDAPSATERDIASKKVKSEDDGNGASSPSRVKKEEAQGTTQSAASQNKQGGAHADTKGASDLTTTLKASDDTKNVLIKINRAPVLSLFAACAAQLQHPKLSWSACLSLGSAVSTICALSKGRTIGTIAPAAAADDHHHHGGTKDKESTVRVLGFDVAFKNSFAYVGDAKKPANEGYLKSKFGQDAYARVKSVMQESLQTWSSDTEDFDKQAFRMYEAFRPGSGGWGQQGGLDIEQVKRAILR